MNPTIILSVLLILALLWIILRERKSLCDFPRCNAKAEAEFEMSGLDQKGSNHKVIDVSLCRPHLAIVNIAATVLKREAATIVEEHKGHIEA